MAEPLASAPRMIRLAFAGMPGYDTVAAGYTTRHGGASAAPFTSLNCGYSAGDLRDVVLDNRRRALAELDLSADDLVVGGQVHGTHIAIVTRQERGRGAEGPEFVLPQTDGLITDAPALPLGVLTADCVPVFLAVADPPVVGVLHAGWRGTLGGILPRAIEILRENWSIKSSNVMITFGPAIGPCCFEVREDVAGPAAQHPATDGHLRRTAPDRWHFDLEGHVASQARRAGVRDEHIARTRRCTVCENRDFYSYRREGPRSGRTLSVVALRGKA